MQTPLSVSARLAYLKQDMTLFGLPTTAILGGQAPLNCQGYISEEAEMAWTR